MRRSIRIFVAVAAGLLFLAPAFAANGPTFPELTGPVVDEAGILSSQTRSELASISDQERSQTGDQIVVVTLRSLQGYPIEQYGYQLGRHWAIGQKGKDNGALLIIAPKEHEMRIEVGYGLEGQLTDAQTKLIIAEVITPAFKRGDYDSGVLAGVNAIVKTLGGAAITPDRDYNPDEASDRGNGGSIGEGIIPIIILAILFWIGGWRFLAGLLLGNMLSGRGRNGGGGFGGGWGGGGFGGGGFGGGGYSGGGGSFGGGGASGSW